MNAITIELCAEDRARMDALTDALTGVGGLLVQVLDRLGQSAPPAPPAPDDLTAKLQETLDNAKAAAPAAPSAPVREVSLAEFQKALSLRCAESADMKGKVRALLNQYAAAASAVPPEMRPEILEKLEGLR